jgi:hypothetical protein
MKVFDPNFIYIVNGKRKRKVKIYKMSCKREGPGQRRQSQRDRRWTMGQKGDCAHK